MRAEALVVAVVAALTLPLPVYWVFLATSAVISAVVMQSAGVVTGRAGMISLCQMSFAGIGAWTVGWLNVHHAPGGLFLWLPLAGLAAVPFGVAIGLPALRLRGVNLAVVTLGFAAAVDVVIGASSFPGQTRFLSVPRPAGLVTDRGYLAFTLVVFALLALALRLLTRTRHGAAWLAVRHSERAAAALGGRVATIKLGAFAVSAFVAAIGGGLLAGQLGTVVSGNFAPLTSLTVFVLATMAGAQHTEGALFAGVLLTFFPELLRRLGLPQDLGNILFAVGAIQAMSQGVSTSEAVRGAIARHRPAAPRRTTRREGGVPEVQGTTRREPVSEIQEPTMGTTRREAVLEIRGLTIRYGRVVAGEDVTITVPAGTVVGLIGPNGSGKSSCIDAATGFLPGYTGTVRLDGRPLDRLAAHRRARSGLRRTFQTTRIAPELTAEQYLRVAARRRLSRHEVAELLDWVGGPAPGTHVRTVDAAGRRLLDVAGTLAARPRAVLLDEPAAGLTHQESASLAARLAEVPARFGTSVLLVEHDVDVVRAACATVYVLDFGRVIAAGPPATTLADDSVVRAFLGAEVTG